MKKDNRFKKNLTIGLSVCVVTLSGAVYGYNQKNTPTTPSVKENPTTLKKGTPLNPIGSEEDEVLSIPKKEAQDTTKGTTDSFRSTLLTPQIDSFRSNSGTQNLIDERNEALALLSTNVLNDQKKEEKPAAVESQQPAPVNPTPTVPTPPPVIVEPSEPQEPENPVIPPVVEVDYSQLAFLVAQAQKTDLKEYVSSSTEVFSAELLISERVLETMDSSQQTIDNQVWRLQEAMNGLVKKGNKENLIVVYDQGLQLQTDIYTAESLTTFELAMERAKELLENSDVSQETMDQAQNQLLEAISNLKEKEEPELSLAYLNRIVSEAQNIQLEDYTSTTAERLSEVLQATLDYIELGEYSKEMNEQWQEDLQGAINSLEKKGDRTQLLELLEKATAIQREMYEESSLNVLDAAVESITDQLNNEDLLQYEIDALEIQLQEAIDQLELIE